MRARVEVVRRKGVRVSILSESKERSSGIGIRMRE